MVVAALELLLHGDGHRLPEGGYLGGVALAHEFAEVAEVFYVGALGGHTFALRRAGRHHDGVPALVGESDDRMATAEKRI